MRQESFGNILSEARRRSGYSIDDIASALRIRPDIVVAIERSDLHALPPRAYTRNMISKYARLVDADPEYLMTLYDDSSYMTDISDVRSSGASSQRKGQFGTVSTRSRGFANAGSGQRTDEETFASGTYNGRGEADYRAPLRMPTASNSSAYSTPRDANAPSSANAYAGSITGRISYDMNDDRNPASPRSRSDARAQRMAPEDAPARRSRARQSSSGTMGANRDIADTRRRTHQSSRLAIPDSRPNNLYTSPRSSHAAVGSSNSKIVRIFVVVIVALILIFAIVSMTKKDATSSKATATTAPISGLTDTTASEEESAQAIVAPVAPTSLEFAYSVSSGSEAYIEIYLDDEETASLAEVVSGPAKGSYTVTGSLRFVCTQPDVVKLTVDGEAVTMTADEDTSWLYEYSIDFPTYLAEWEEEHAEEIAAAEAAKAELLAAQEAAKSSTADAGSSATNSSSGKTTTSN